MRLITLEDSMYDVDERVERMDGVGIDSAVVSATGWTNFCDTLSMSREYNDLLAEAISPTRRCISTCIAPRRTSAFPFSSTSLRHRCPGAG